MKKRVKTGSLVRSLILLSMDVAISVAVSIFFVAFSQNTRATGLNAVALLCVTQALLIVIWQFIFGTFNTMWRYASSSEYIKLGFPYAAGLLSSAAILNVGLDMDFSRLFMLSCQCASLLVSLYMRMLYKVGKLDKLIGIIPSASKTRNKRPIAIIGAGSAGVSLANEIGTNVNSPYFVWGFFDDDPSKLGKLIHGIRVRGTISQLPSIVKTTSVNDFILAIPSMDVKRRQEVKEICGKLNGKLRVMPDTMTLIDGRDASLMASVRDIRMEDLLGRTTVKLSNEESEKLIRNRTVLVTGGGGSIGSELCTQVLDAGCAKLVILDVNENDTYFLYRELCNRWPDADIDIVIGSVANRTLLKSMFDKYHPACVFHAAAHKHVPLMQDNICEAVRNNIFGTYNVLMETYDHRCDRFMLISTDKAVNPTNVMGATKRYCELMVSAMSTLAPGNTTFTAVRFGNVLGSHGSVIPLFQSQIARGGPVTLTDKRVERYFMTIPEAVALILKASSIASGNEVFILDMGEPVRILDLAENLIRLSGFEPYSDIDIREIGLRPGEKLYEELTVDSQKHFATSLDRVFVEQVKTIYPMTFVESDLKDFSACLEVWDNDGILKLLRRFVPSFRDASLVNSEAIASGMFSTADPVPAVAKIPESEESKRLVSLEQR